MERPLTGQIRPGEGPLSLEAYEQTGGYQALRKALLEMSPGEVTQVVKDSNLRGRGGAGFPTGAKWGFVPMGDDAPRPKYLVANADEMEPGTFKDRMLLEGNPHLLLEGMLLSAYAIQADVAYIFIRWAYKQPQQYLRRAIAEAYQAGYAGRNVLGTGWNLEMSLHASAGRYICGEESALLNALEGGRAIPRQRPPFPPVVGLTSGTAENLEAFKERSHPQFPIQIIEPAEFYQFIGVGFPRYYLVRDGEIVDYWDGRLPTGVILRAALAPPNE